SATGAAAPAIRSEGKSFRQGWKSGAGMARAAVGVSFLNFERNARLRRLKQGARERAGEGFVRRGYRRRSAEEQAMGYRIVFSLYGQPIFEHPCLEEDVEAGLDAAFAAFEAADFGIATGDPDLRFAVEDI